MLDSGKYRARASGIECGRAASGTEQVGITFEVFEDGEGSPIETSYITWYGYFTDEAGERTVKTLRVCGMQGNDLDKVTIEDLPSVVELELGYEEYQGKQNLKVKWVNQPGSGVAMKDKMTPQEKVAFAQRMKGLFLSVPATGVSKPAASRPAPSPRPAAPATPRTAPRATTSDAEPDPDYPTDFGDDQEIPF
jgi:hypothetical protein